MRSVRFLLVTTVVGALAACNGGGNGGGDGGSEDTGETGDGDGDPSTARWVPASPRG